MEVVSRQQTRHAESLHLHNEATKQTVYSVLTALTVRLAVKNLLTGLKKILRLKFRQQYEYKSTCITVCTSKTLFKSSRPIHVDSLSAGQTRCTSDLCTIFFNSTSCEEETIYYHYNYHIIHIIF